jgi:uncharacterized NAD-dependent epimerase/dehydratase family protein
LNSRIANTTKGLVAKNKRFHIVTLNDLVEALMHKQRVEKEEKSLEEIESMKNKKNF